MKEILHIEFETKIVPIEDELFIQPFDINENNLEIDFWENYLDKGVYGRDLRILRFDSINFQFFMGNI